jgi:hypothetical protein
LSLECWCQCEHPPKWHQVQGAPWHGQRCSQSPNFRGKRSLQCHHIYH